MAFTLHIFESEYKEIEGFVLKYPSIETGGDLFGLWKGNGHPVVQLIIGPGENCRRTAVSFHQDTRYLANVGTHVNTTYMLCHIGSWHSHHQLSLTQPSAGDRSTVCNNFPAGLERYIMIIANIGRGTSGRQAVHIHPYMFTNGGHVCRQGDVKIIREKSPFRDVGYVLNRLGNGAEHRVSTNAEPHYAPLGSKRNKTSSWACERETENSPPVITNEKARFSPTGNQRATDRSSPQHQNARNGLQGQNHLHGKSMQTYEDRKEHKQWYETEKGGSILKELHQELETSMHSDISYSRSSYSKDLTMDVTHNGQKWHIDFPKSFDNEPAKITDLSNGNKYSVKNIVKTIRRACKCNHCQYYESDYQYPPQQRQDRQPSPQDHHRPASPNQARQPSPQDRHRPSSPNRAHQPSPQGRHRPSSPSQGRQVSPQHRSQSSSSPRKQSATERVASTTSRPWYNTATGKNILDGIKTDIERASNNFVRIRTCETTTSKELIFYHNLDDWIIEFKKSRQEVNMKVERYGRKSFVATLVAPYDVVRELTKHCPCTNCRTARRPLSDQKSPTYGKARENLRYSAQYRDNVGQSRASSATPGHEKFFAADSVGQSRFRKICLDISSLLLRGKEVDLSRNTESRDIEINFEHGGYQWKIKFPFNFPKELPELGYIRLGKYCRIPIINVSDILPKIRKYCLCRSCSRYLAY